MFKNVLCWIIIILFSGCASLKLPVSKNEILSKKSVFKPDFNLKKIMSAPVLNVNLESTFEYHIPSSVAGIPEKQKNKMVSFSVNEVPFIKFLNVLQNLIDIPIGIELEKINKDSLPDITLNYQGKLYPLLTYLSQIANLWVFYENGFIIFKDLRNCDATIPLFLTNQQGELKNLDLKMSATTKNLKDVIAETVKKLNIKVNVLSEQTGYIQFSSRPQQARTFINFLKKEVKNASDFVAVKISTFQLSLNKNKGLYFNINFLLNLPGVYEANVLSGLNPSSSSLTLNIKNANKLNFFISYLNKLGRLEVLNTTTLVTQSGVPSEFGLVKKIGWFEPGALSEVYGAAGEHTVTYKQDKPSWEEDDTGLKVIIRPKVVNKEYVLLDLLLSNSEVYDTKTFSWRQFPNVPPIILEKPLKSEKHLLNRAILKKGEYLVVAGFRSSKSDKEKDLITSSKTEKDSYLFFIVSVDF